MMKTYQFDELQFSKIWDDSGYTVAVHGENVEIATDDPRLQALLEQAENDEIEFHTSKLKDFLS